LMIDDHPPIIEGYKAILSFNAFGYEFETVTAYHIKAAYDIITAIDKPDFDVIFVDITLPPLPEQNIESGVELIPLLKTYCPKAKIVVLTSHDESLLLYKIYKENNPEGILIKSDFMPEEFLTAFDTIVKGNYYYSPTVLKLQKSWSNEEKVLDGYNSQILLLLSQGIKTKNMPNILNLSISAIDKRKVILKNILGIDKGSDEDILREARKQGLI
jgi:two-component system, NarL family, response regulator NreC